MSIGLDGALLALCNGPSPDLNVIRYLVRKGAKVDIQDDENSETPLHLVCQHAKLDCVQFLVKRGADVHARDKWDETPLHRACKWRAPVEVVRFLIQNGADIHARGISDYTPLHMACDTTHLETTQLGTMKLLLNLGADVHARGSDSLTPLHVLCKSRYIPLEGITMLTSRGGIPFETTTDGKTALHLVATHPNPEGVEAAVALIFLGVDVNMKTVKGRTPLHEACTRSNLAMVQRLVEKGADIHARDILGRTPLLWACQDSTLEVVQFLVEAGADIRAADACGETCLALTSDPHIIYFLMTKPLAQRRKRPRVDHPHSDDLRVKACIACERHVACVAFVECGHVPLCNACEPKLEKPDVCPVCRAEPCTTIPLFLL
jgi:ankyrin repeat protein